MKNQGKQLTLVSFGQRIKELRLGRSISQEELADVAGVHRTYIGMIERGEKNITLLTMLKLAKALDVTLCDLVKEFKSGK